MDITKDNFDASLALVEDTIVKWADFCAIDLEFTGGEEKFYSHTMFTSSKVETCASKNHYLDTITERYKRIVGNYSSCSVVFCYYFYLILYEQQMRQTLS
jgi:CAF1 family ribonuclease